MNSQPQGCLSVILKLFGIRLPDGGGGVSTAKFPFQRKDYLLSKAERAFFAALQQAVGADFLIFSKVRLADLIFVRRGTEKRQAFFNRIQAKHIDFILCDNKMIRPMLAIELDDSSHDRKDRQDRDDFVDAALGAAALPILHVRASSGYLASELREAIQSQLEA